MEDYYVRFDSEMKGNWDRLWKLQIPPKVRDFLWPIARNVIPTRERLQQKGLDVEDDCLFCGAHKDFVHEEDLRNQSCVLAWSIWSALNNLLWHVAPALESMGAAHRVQGRWFKPPEGVLKCNVDGNVNIAGGCVGFGVLLWDSNGRFDTALTSIVQGMRIAREAEVIALGRLWHG
ncbi:hypothetical protein GH714_005145 [Hevea brasiliensis]|uniref:Reverse transcriptase zinc-binding domain-containing protein n=1 Tax=Hevea brasiliensis TaxID=3981 RepID=A0A6A6L890_HEVBR|nr:hypothetical protein GH714_005145 [Hevea brasiliensis]